MTWRGHSSFFLFVAIAVASTRPAGAATVTGHLVGGPISVFNTAKESCELIDIPDAPARAFRDFRGTVHLVSSHYVMRASLGPSLETVKHSCQVAYSSDHDPNPADFNDDTWLDSFFALGGKFIVALGHMEYHGWEHPGMCSSQNYTPACWYNADTFHLSVDGGYRFHSFPAPYNFVAGLPYKYEVNRGPEGYSIDTNVIKVGRWYYAMVTDWQWPPNCGDLAHPCLVPFGGAPIRTSNVLNPSSWRGWDGRDFSVEFVDPYLRPVSYPERHIYAPVPFMYYVNAINYSPLHDSFLATLFDPFNTAYGVEGMYLSTSPDLVHWTTPTLVVSVAQLLAREPAGNWSYLYFSLLDPHSTDLNFSTLSDNPDLYYVRFDDNNPPYTRVLFRQRVRLTWR